MLKCIGDLGLCFKMSTKFGILVTHIHPAYVSDFPQDILFAHHNMSIPRTDFISSLKQRYSLDGHPKDVLHDDKHWKLSYPHERSGPCHTYNPLYESDPGLNVATFIVMKGKSWDPKLEIFLHDENQLYYSHNLRHDFYLKPITLDEANINPARLKGKHFET